MNLAASKIYKGKEKSFRMFDRIHRRYDLLNHLFSFGQDIIWRYKLGREIEKKDNQRLLDLATGTGDTAFSLLKHSSRIKHADACDMAGRMLQLARKKAVKKNLSGKISLLQGDAANIPYVDNIFDVVTMAFGIRNVTNPSLVLTEIFRVLKTGGKALILEFSLPANNILRKLHLFYLRHIIPRVGAVISRDKHAYLYLNKTIETFPYGESFCQLMQTAGFRNIRFNPLTFGVVTIYQGEK